MGMGRSRAGYLGGGGRREEFFRLEEPRDRPGADAAMELVHDPAASGMTEPGSKFGIS